MPEIVVADVGQGSCTLVRSEQTALLIDSPCGESAFSLLEQLGIKKLDYVFVSHSDQDHIAGVLALLTDDAVEVSKLFVNPDASKGKLWDSFRRAVRIARERSGTKVVTSLTSTTPGTISLNGASVSVVAPTPELILGGAGTKDLEKRPLTTNSVSAVIRVETNELGLAIIAGDIDGTGLKNLLKEAKDLSAKVLVFPHHGGLPNDVDSEEFVRTWLEAVKPDHIVFSNGRGRYDHPNAEIVSPIVRFSTASISCTQLSRKCALAIEGLSGDHLLPLPSLGKSEGHCCAGTMVFAFDNSAKLDGGQIVRHRDFVERFVPDRLCAKKG